MVGEQRDKSRQISELKLYTDGACSGNPGVGGWACILIAGSREKEVSGSEAMTTNNRMEMRAVIEGLSLLKWPCRVHIYSDSAYVVNAFRESWIEAWQKRGWKNSASRPVANEDLWKRLLELGQRHDLIWHKVMGHSNDLYNERCDRLAVEAVRAYKRAQES